MTPDAGEHADNRLADRLVIHVAIVRAIHADFEAVRIACVRQQLLGAVRIVFRTHEILREGEELRRDHQGRRGREAAHDAGLDRLDVDGLEEAPGEPSESLKGFLPFTFENSSSSRVWSKPRKMVRKLGAGHDLRIRRLR